VGAAGRGGDSRSRRTGRSHAVPATYDLPMSRGRNDRGTGPDSGRVAAPADLLSPATQIVGDREAYLGQGGSDIGRRISDDQVELFVAGDAAQSLQVEFEMHAPEYIALHDVGARASLRLLASLAGAAGARVQRLTIRHQGHGAPLAVLQFIEVQLADGTPVRIYSTDVSVDGGARVPLARVLLAYSRLGVLMMGSLQQHLLHAQLSPLHEAMRRGPWPNRDLLMVPLGPSIPLAVPATQLSADSPVAVHVTPQASKPRQAWAFIGGAWNRLHGAPGGERALPTELARAVPRPRKPASEETTEPMALRPLPDLMRDLSSAHGPLSPPLPMPVPGATRWQSYVDRCAAIKGAVASCAFDRHTMSPLAYSGSGPAAERLAQQGAALLEGMNDAARALGMGSLLQEGTVSTATHHLLLRPVPGHPGIVLHLVLTAADAHLVLARMQLDRIEPPR